MKQEHVIDELNLYLNTMPAAINKSDDEPWMMNHGKHLCFVMVERIEKTISYSFYHGLRYTNITASIESFESVFSVGGRVLMP